MDDKPPGWGLWKHPITLVILTLLAILLLGWLLHGNEWFGIAPRD